MEVKLGVQSTSIALVSGKVGDGGAASTEISLETGKLAQQADGAVIVRAGDTIVMATAVMGKKREGIEFFPLMVDYEERLYAAGKIKGSRWVKREGRATDTAVLTGRVIDRSIRPLFNPNARNDVQVVVTVLCIDGVNEPDILAVTAASAALTISDIPFDGPIGGVRVGKIDGHFVVNPSREQIAQSSMDLIVCGTGSHIIMVEAGANIVPESDIVAGIKLAQPELAKICAAQAELAKNRGNRKTQRGNLPRQRGCLGQSERTRHSSQNGRSAVRCGKRAARAQRERVAR